MRKEIRDHIARALEGWVEKQGISGLPYFSLEAPPEHVSGDLSSNLALLLGPVMGRPPRTVAAEIAPLINVPEIATVELAGPGFLNFKINTVKLVQELKRILLEGEKYGKEQHKKYSGKLLIEFVSANPTGPLHVGHGRGAALGDSLSRIMRHLGHNVHTEYYINDVGNQMEMLGLSVEARLKELGGETITFPQDGYKGDYIREIAKSYSERKSTSRFSEFALEYILGEIKNDLELFGINFDSWYRESALYRNGVVDACINKLQTLGLIYESEGALWFAATKFGDEKDRVLKRQDERHTYFASDIAYHAEKYNRGFSRLIDIWGTDHHGYAPRLRAAVSAIGSSPDNLTIILYQLVSLSRGGVKVSMSTRSGEFITLREVINEVGRDACRFFFAMRSPQAQLDFDLELAKKQAPENPVYYVQYVHARCGSIFKEAQKRNVSEASSPKGRALKDESVSPPERFASSDTWEIPENIPLEKEERALLLKLAFFPDVLETCAGDLSPHHLTTYLLDVARTFHKFYETCRVLGVDSETTRFRLALVKAVKTVIAAGLNLLAVSAPEKM